MPRGPPSALGPPFRKGGRTEDGAGLRRVALLEGRLGVEVVARRLDESRDRLALGGRGDLVNLGFLSDSDLERILF